MEEQVRRLTIENRQLKKERDRGSRKSNQKAECSRYGNDNCKQGKQCPANGQKCSICKKPNHFSRVRRTKKENIDVAQLSSDESSDEDCDRIVINETEEEEPESINTESEVDVASIESEVEEPSKKKKKKKKKKRNKVTVKKLDSSITAKIRIVGMLPFEVKDNVIDLATDTGVKHSILNYTDWRKIKKSSGMVKASKKFRPYGTPATMTLNIIGKALVTMTAEAGAQILTWVYIHKSETEKSLLGEKDALRLGIVTLNLKGATEEVLLADEETEVVNRIPYATKEDPPSTGIVSGGETQAEIDSNMEKLKQRHPKAFTHRTGKFKGSPIKLHYPEEYTPHIQPNRRIPLHYTDPTYKELQKLIDDDVYEGPIETEEPGTFINNLVITDKKNSDGVRITIDCREVNKILYATHESIPTVEELRQLVGSDRFSVLDLTNCFCQFEIEESARKLFAFRTR